MPYISPDRRRVLEFTAPQKAGELNYCITGLLTEYLEQFTLCYATINDILGALEGAKLEFYRRVAVPYEDEKMAENGDVY